MTEARETALHRALADERRARIVQELGEAPGGLDVQELAGRLGLHPNTMRWHLGILGDAGLVDARAEVRSTPGRPRILYTPAAVVAERGGGEHRLLASILTSALAGLPDGSERAEEAGRAWGRHLVHKPLRLVGTGDGEAVREIVQLLDQQGFAPEAQDSQVCMRRCPFHELAATHPEIVCVAHRGLIAGALDELGSGLEVDELQILVEPDLCVARLSRRPQARGS